MYADGALIKGIPALKDNFIENTFGAQYTLRFDGINFTVPKDGSVDVVLKASVQSNPLNTAATTFKFLANAFRGRDSIGIDQYTSTEVSSAALAPTDASTGTLTGSLNANTVKLGFATGNTSATTSNVELLSTDVKAENRDVTLRTVTVDITDLNTVASAIKLYDGSTLLASVAGPGSAPATFTNLNILIAKDTTKTLNVKADIKPLAANCVVAGEEDCTGAAEISAAEIAAGLPITAAISFNENKITAVDSEDTLLATANMSNNTTTGKKQTVYVKAPTFALSSSNIVKTTQAGSADVADATIVLNITANGGDIYFKGSADAGEKFIVTGPAEASAYQYTTTADVSAIDGDYYVVRNGETKSVTITGRITGADAFESMVLTNIK